MSKLKIRREYLNLLGEPSKADLEQKIVRTVRVALDACGRSRPPIRLSAVAEQFKIRPSPEIVRKNQTSTIEFDEESGQFRIYLNPSVVGPRTETDSQVGSHRNLRFTYAHEFAHRFLFVESRERWERALRLVVAARPSFERLSAARTLSILEERLCNRAAGRLLAPEEELVACITGTLDAYAREDASAIWPAIDAIADRFQISSWCAVRRLADVRATGALERLGPSFCFMLIGISSGKGLAGKSRSDIRVIDLIWPDIVGGRQIRPPFPGLALSNLSVELTKAVGDILATSTPLKGSIECPILIEDEQEGGAGRRSRRRALLKGAWREWWSGPSRRIAIQGHIVE